MALALLRALFLASRAAHEIEHVAPWRTERGRNRVELRGHERHTEREREERVGRVWVLTRIIAQSLRNRGVGDGRPWRAPEMLRRVAYNIRIKMYFSMC